MFSLLFFPSPKAGMIGPGGRPHGSSQHPRWDPEIAYLTTVSA